MIKGRETKAAPSTDLLVCFPSRARHLSLMPKPICSPARPSDPNKLGRHHHRKRSLSKGGGGGGGGGGQAASSILWAKSTQSMGSDISEPTSPKVTCAGQIKVKPKTNACRNWQSVMEEIEKIHNDKKQKKRLNWAETLGFKKEVMQFLTCLRSIRFDLRCFGSFPGTDIATEDDDEEDLDDDVEDEEGYHVKVEEGHENETSRTVFSEWFMVLQENNKNNELKEKDKVIEDDETIAENNVPPPNALLLMRCRSAPAKSWLKEESGGGGDNHHHEEKEMEEHEQKEKEEMKVKVLKKGQSLKSLMEKEKRNKENNNMVVKQYDNDFYELSSDIAKETWIVGDLRDSLSRSRSWKR